MIIVIRIVSGRPALHLCKGQGGEGGGGNVEVRRGGEEEDDHHGCLEAGDRDDGN